MSWVDITNNTQSVPMGFINSSTTANFSLLDLLKYTTWLIDLSIFSSLWIILILRASMLLVQLD